MSKQKFKIIAVDYDGTCTTHAYPEIGKDIGSIPVLKELVANGHNLILFTMRSGKQLAEAEKWFADNEIELWASQRNPTQDNWTTSPKCYAQYYIDDAAVGCPLIEDANISDRPFVDWIKMRELLVEKNLL
jgi:hypothetical protein